jgi:hypothetical protein
LSLDTQLEALDRDFYVDGLIDRKRWLAVKQTLETKRDSAQARLAVQTRTLALAPYGAPGTLRDAWAELGIDKQRAILRSVIHHITINPAQRTGRAFDPDRVDVTWLA